MHKCFVASGILSMFVFGCGLDTSNFETNQSSYALTDTVPIYPPNAPDFFVLADGTDLKAYDTSDLLHRRTGRGYSFNKNSTYQQLKKDSKVHWIVRDLDTGAIIAKNSTADKNVYGASVSKALVVATLLNTKNGKLDTSTWQKVYKLLVNSDNNVWSTLENLAGGKNAVRAWTKSMGYTKTVGDRSGNMINSLELSMFLYDVHHQKFPGAEGLLKVMSTCNTGADKSRKYLPKSIYLGGKTGTWNQYYHDMRFLEIGEKRYAIVVLTEQRSDEKVAIMFGGLAREYLPGLPAEPAFIGRSCKTGLGCEGGICLTSYDDGYTFEGGMCTESCKKSCPDQSGEPTTYCMTFNAQTGFFEGDQGHCFSSCDTSYYPGTGCRDGYMCSKLKRHGYSSSTRNVCVPKEDTPQPGNSFVGGPCTKNSQCSTSQCLTSFSDGYTFEGGMCTTPCDKLCPDKSGEPETFCITFNAQTGYYTGDQGQCFSRCDTKRFSGDGCREGYACVKVKRHNQSSVKRNVCVPDGKEDALLIGEAPDAEGDLPNPETMQEEVTAGGCAVAHGSAPLSAAWMWLLAALFVLRSRRIFS